MGVLWAAYTAGSFDHIPEGIDQEDFAETVINWLSVFQSCLIVEDFSKSFKSGIGPVALVLIVNDGEVIKPFAVPFTWATKRNKLRGFASFMQMVKYSSDVGLCVIYGTEEEESIIHRQRRYGHNLWNFGDGIWAFRGRKKNPRRKD